jgi:hypothetical protein
MVLAMHEESGDGSTGGLRDMHEERPEALVVRAEEDVQATEGEHAQGAQAADELSGDGNVPVDERGVLVGEREAETSGSLIRDMVPFEREGHEYPIVKYKGKEFYAIQRYGNGSNTAYTEYREVGAPPQGYGTIPAITPDKSRELTELRNSDSLQRKTARRKEYEEAVYSSLGDVAKLQLNIVSLANDPSASMSYDEIAKAKLGLQAAESILNRALGKAVTKIDAEVSMSVADSMLTMAEDWEIEDAEEV